MAIGQPEGMSAQAYADLLAETPYEAGPRVACGPDDDWDEAQGDHYYRHLPRPATTPMARDLNVFDDKAGPALCIPDGPGVWLFTGFASA
jgi:hypothetical protein